MQYKLEYEKGLFVLRYKLRDGLYSSGRVFLSRDSLIKKLENILSTDEVDFSDITKRSDIIPKDIDSMIRAYNHIIGRN